MRGRCPCCDRLFVVVHIYIQFERDIVLVILERGDGTLCCRPWF